MSLLRIFGIGKKKQREARYEDPVDGLALAREEMLNRMRARAEAAPVEPAPVVYEPGPAAPGAAGGEPAPVGLPETDPLAGITSGDAETEPGGEGPGQGKRDSGDMDPDLLDVFRDAKEEVEEGSLAAELEDIPISDLLGDVVSVSSRLGVRAKPRSPEPVRDVRRVVVEPEPEVPEPDEAEASEPEEPPPVVHQVAPKPPEEAPEPGTSMNAAGDDDYEYNDPPVSGSGGQRYVLHVLFLGLTLALASGLGVRGTRGAGFVAQAEATPAVLDYLSPPVVPPEPEPEGMEIGQGGMAAFKKQVHSLPEKSSPAPTPTPSPAPTPSPTPEPQVRAYPFIPGQPAWFMYAIQSGDSLSSIADAFGICPDHILWNNPGRKEEDRLIVGDEILLPGYRGIVYRFREGETLAQVAARYGTTADMVLAYPGNRLRSPDEVGKGTVVLLPEGIPPSALLQDTDAQWAYTNPSEYGYIWPFYGPITTYYGEERPGYTHYGIDIGGLWHYGAPVLAVAEGRVDKVEDLYGGLGRYAVISHPDGSRTVYGHMSDLYVQAGDYVQQGEPVGALGCSGHSTGTHLHFELWRGGRPVDPLDYLP